MMIPDIQRKTDTSITSILLYWLNLTPTQSIYLLTTYYPQKVLNLLFAQRLDSYLKSSKFQSPNLLDFSSLYSFIFYHFIFCQIFSFGQVYKIFIIPAYCRFLRFIYLFLYILFTQKKGVLKTCSKFTGEPSCRSVISVKLKFIESNFMEMTLRHGCSSVNLLYIFRIPFPNNISGWLVLQIL